MAIALPLIAQLVAPLQSAVEWLSGASTTAAANDAEHDAANGAATGAHSGNTSDARPLSRPTRPGPKRAFMQRPTRTWSGPTRAPQPQPQRSVRVVRVVDDRAAAGSVAGRMVISGRLADVCAELDRLAATEMAA
ncbi:hypothetical protein JI739_01200 [Ramlibacter sp. AW1]|uniref:Uncharacterized protein n=1 Tax=Ramlibacter aurantiacus TaxID=2801330 RepID=A0A936ZQ50_9BURK|nr:hypothetical protein [Ramlibacter aurantiacus]MBL0418950.1 hypothetical protein [Ramlibacter aurantiacus]